LIDLAGEDGLDLAVRAGLERIRHGSAQVGWYGWAVLAT
jgi:hypothetical protein